MFDSNLGALGTFIATFRQSGNVNASSSVRFREVVCSVNDPFEADALFQSRGLLGERRIYEVLSANKRGRSSSVHAHVVIGVAREAWEHDLITGGGGFEALAVALERLHVEKFGAASADVRYQVGIDDLLRRRDEVSIEFGEAVYVVQANEPLAFRIVIDYPDGGPGTRLDLAANQKMAVVPLRRDQSGDSEVVELAVFNTPGKQEPFFLVRPYGAATISRSSNTKDEVEVQVISKSNEILATIGWSRDCLPSDAKPEHRLAKPESPLRGVEVPPSSSGNAIPLRFRQAAAVLDSQTATRGLRTLMPDVRSKGGLALRLLGYALPRPSIFAEIDGLRLPLDTHGRPVDEDSADFVVEVNKVDRVTFSKTAEKKTWLIDRLTPGVDFALSSGSGRIFAVNGRLGERYAVCVLLAPKAGPSCPIYFDEEVHRIGRDNSVFSGVRVLNGAGEIVAADGSIESGLERLAISRDAMTLFARPEDQTLTVSARRSLVCIADADLREVSEVEPGSTASLQRGQVALLGAYLFGLE